MEAHASLRYVEDKDQWLATAKVVSAIKSYDVSAGEAGSWVEGVAEPGSTSALQEIQSKIKRRLTRVEERSAVTNVWSYYRDPGRIEGLKKDFDKALASFQLRTNLTIGVKLSTIEDSLDRLEGAIGVKLSTMEDSLDRLKMNGPTAFSGHSLPLPHWLLLSLLYLKICRPMERLYTL
ncbi:uncharacterized protein EI90DRAFT_3015148 [Cantharellus anzutake]|uniref:uncharacterized protein n=1 Tax=Cantharellus anzutake TaxID=1750568 RepID=UPI0019077604|nr:uncharacterized protein EI90DRAFT_3015148 [Cantharellus anzutake]KAF8334109.1 hypothetical protein EI90DRAFT_3015148 [Cantharellus anzutake]